MDPLNLVRPDLAALEGYAAVQPPEALARELGLPAGEIVKLDANENPWGTHPAVREAVARAPFHLYPDPAQTALREALARYCGVDPGQIVCGQGADDLIDLALRLFAPAVIVDNVPTFGMYSFLARVNNARVIEVPRGEGFAVDVEANERAVRGGGATLVFVTSPNNPTGNVLPLDDLERLLALPAIVVLDEAYVEFGARSAAPLLSRHGNLIILRTFSKWAGLAGLRVGYALAAPSVVSLLLAIKQPYNVSVTAEAAARAALDHTEELLARVKSVITERERMAALVMDLGWLRPYPSQANFVLFEVQGADALAVARQLRQRGILVRFYDTPLLRNFIRISAGRPQDTDRLLSALKEVGKR